jgi:hypothetical protein
VNQQSSLIHLLYSIHKIPNFPQRQNVLYVLKSLMVKFAEAKSIIGMASGGGGGVFPRFRLREIL